MTVKCGECGAEVPKIQGRGRQPKYCSERCKKSARKAQVLAKPRQQCTVAGCESAATRPAAGLCEKHYYRMRRQGTTDYVGQRTVGESEHSGGYVLTPAPGHPRSLGGYRAYAHRVVFTDAHGEGPFSCHWCGKTVTWGDMHVDHLNDDKKDNRVANLVASCGPCNQQRGHHKLMTMHRERTGIEFQGEKLTVNEWAARIGISGSALVYRLKNGWSLEKALTEARGVTGPRPKE